jgi:amino acid adenylation domain-containing protein
MPPFDPPEPRQLLVECNRTEADYPRRLGLPQLFDQQAERSPDATAVIDDDRSLSYRQVRWRSDALARGLLRRGIEPGARIGILVPRSADLVVVPLGILKSGNTYVPLDPVYPPERLAHIINTSELAAIVGRPSVPPLPGRVPFIAVDELIDPDTMPEPMELPDVQPDEVAYIIFTSGSTGRPKGVQIPHRALTNFLWSMRQTPGITAQDVVVAVTTLCFDIAVLELFLPLIVGARVVIANDDETRDGRLLLALLQESNATMLQATPATWQILIEMGWDGDPQLRMLCGGEALSRELADRLLVRSPELWNMYGPTETTVWSAACRVTADDAPVPIGPPIANTQFYLVDRDGKPVPSGTAGELLIGGDGVATGYWRMPEATQERFVPDTFRNLPGARVYRTGDLARMLPDGRLQFLGRADEQIKIRGFRVELGEIETALLRHPDVRQAVAVAGEGAAKETTVFAYVVLRQGAGARREDVMAALRKRLAETLPAYMRPTAILPLDALPRLPNGKIDRKGLPRPSTSGSPVNGAPLGPLSDMESRLMAMWRDVLGLQTIDPTGNFFDLGGHSFLAARLLARVEAEFGRRISLSALFEAPTFDAFVRLVERAWHREQDFAFDFRQVVRLRPQSEQRGIFAINNTGIFFSLSKALGESLPVTALQLFDPTVHQDLADSTVEEVAARYAALIRQLEPSGPYALLGWCNGGVLAFEIARQLRAAGQDVGWVVVIDTWAPGYLNRLGWLRSKLADYSYRWQMVALDWAKVRARQKTLRRFLAERKVIRICLGRGRAPSGEAAPDQTAAELYDNRLFQHIARMVQGYEPEPFDGRLMVIRNSQEPQGGFLPEKLGWSGFATGGIKSVVVPGDHWSIFREPGVSLMARHIKETVPAHFGPTRPA